MSITHIPTAALKNLPLEMQNFEPVAVICNILPEPVLPIVQTYGVYHIGVPRQGERFALTPVNWAALYMDKGDSVFNLMNGRGNEKSVVQDNRIRTLQGAREIAEDLCQQMNMSDGPNAFWGKFVCAGLEPTERELKDAETRMRDYFLHVVSVADRIWSANPRHDLIDSRCKIAAKHLNITQKPWLSPVQAMTECPACVEPIRLGAAICRFCGYIIDRTRAEKLNIDMGARQEEPLPSIDPPGDAETVSAAPDVKGKHKQK